MANSGLFYESHLVQFAAGTRTLDELTQGPQAGLNASVKVTLTLPGSGSGSGSGSDQYSSSVCSTGNSRLTEVPGLPDTAASNAVSTEYSKALELNGIHPDAAPLVRQAAATNKAESCTWSTRLALTLPTLKDVEVHISLAGTTLQIHLAVCENAARALLSKCHAELLRRFEELGLQLIGMQIGPLPAASTAQETPKGNDARCTLGVGREDDRPNAIARSHANKSKEPIAVAKGYGAVADLVVQRAHESGLYVHKSLDLVKLLMQVNWDAEIPTRFYAAIAEVLVWLYQLERIEAA